MVKGKISDFIKRSIKLQNYFDYNWTLHSDKNLDFKYIDFSMNCANVAFSVVPEIGDGDGCRESK